MAVGKRANMSHGKNILVQIIPYDPNGSVFEPLENCLEKSPSTI